MKFKLAFRKVFYRIFGFYSKTEIDDWTRALNDSFNDMASTINDILLELRINELISEKEYQRMKYNEKNE